MPTDSQLFGLVVGAGALAALLGLLAIARGFVGDRSRGRRRCPRCWYEMGSIPGLRCPECGREARSEARLHRARRRWRLILAGLVLIGIASSSALYPRVRGKPWTQLAPTTILLLAIPSEQSVKGAIWSELIGRLSPRQGVVPQRLYGWQRRLAAWRASTALAQSPGSPAGNLGLWMLHQLGSDAAPGVPALIAFINNKAFDPWERARAVALLGVIGAPEAERTVPVLIRLVESTDSSLQSSAVIALGQIGSAAAPAVPPLARLLDKRAPYLAPAAARALGLIGPDTDGARRSLATAVQAESAELRAAAAEAILPHPGALRVALQELGAACASGDSASRMRAALALAEFGPAAAPVSAQLATALGDPDAMTRYAAARSLTRIGPGSSAAAPALEQRARDDPDGAVRAQSAAALRALGLQERSGADSPGLSLSTPR